MKKKVLSIILCVVMVFSMAISVSAAARTEVESNDTRATANAIYAGDTMTGKMGKSGDIDCFVYTPASSGTITVKMTGIANNCIYNLWLQNTSGAALTSASTNGTVTTSKSYTYNVTAGTTYYIVANAASGYNASTKYTISLSLAASGSTKTLSVTRQKQQYPNWCWAACTSMLTNYESVGKTQAQIVTNKYGSIVDKTGQQSDIVAALKWASSAKFSNALYTNLTSSTYQNVVVNRIMANKPVQVACVPVSNPNNSGHSYIIYAVQNTSTVKMIDPWGTNANLTMTSTTLTTNGFYSSVIGTNLKGISSVVY